jgi:hypothetical protein
MMWRTELDERYEYIITLADSSYIIQISVSTNLTDSIMGLNPAR